MQNAFEPHEMATLMRLVDKACAELGACDEATKSTIAARVLAYASQGESDPDVLLLIALNGRARAEHAQ